MNASVMNQVSASFERDELTGLLSMDGIIRLIQAGGIRKKDHCCMVYMSIPLFKTININYGYEYGNRFLREVAEGIIEELPCAYAARESSHHFVFAIPDLSIDEIKEGFGRLQERVGTTSSGDKLYLKAGIAECSGVCDVFSITDRARRACFYAERHKQPFQVFDAHVEKELTFQQHLIRHFEEACTRGDIQPYYQPEIRVLSKECCGFEALARWIDDRYGTISPGVFIPLLEQEGLVHKLDLHIIRTVCRDIRRASDLGWPVVPVSVNLSRTDFRLLDMIREIESCREEFRIPRDLLHIEITESAVAEDEEYMISIIEQFRALGYQVWMDDFGSGYSSLNNLQMYQFDVLKIDMSFLKQLPDNPRTGIIVASVINMAKRLGIETLAEGVETEEQYEFLREVGCEKLQGFLFGRPERLIRTKETFAYENDLLNRMVFETEFSRAYYSSIGHVNMLSSTPMDEELLEFKNRIPITVIETTDSEEIHFLYANEAYIRFLHAVQIDNIDAAQKRSNQQYLAENTEFLKLAKRTEASGRMKGELLINGVLFNTDISFIARDRDRAAFLTIVRDLGNIVEERQSEGVRLAQEYVLSAYFRIDLFEEDGTAINLYLNADQRKLTDVDFDSVRLVSQYAEQYIRADEGDSFCEFYDMNTVLERVRLNGGHHVTKYFHSAIPGEEGRIQKYTIIPFRHDHSWKYLSLCMYAEHPPKDMLKELIGE